MKRLSHILLLIFLCVACEHKELCYDHSHVVPVEVSFDWTDAPEAQAKSMSIYFFPVEGGEPMRYEFTDMEGGVIRVPAGHYHVITINSDTEYVRYRNKESFQTFEVYPRDADMLTSLSSFGLKSDEVIPRAPGTEEQRIAYEPDMMWSDRMMDLILEEGEVDVALPLKPKSIVEKYQIRIDDVENLKYANEIGGAVTGMAAGYLLGTGELSTECVTHSVELRMSEDRTALTGEFYTFGHCPDEEHQTEHHFTVYSLLSDGTKWYYTFDVTEPVHELDRQEPEEGEEGKPEIKEILLEGLPLPKPITNGGGFQPEVGDWNTEYVEIQM